MPEGKCMMLDLRADPEVIEQPDSKYAANTEYRCRRCGHSFSSPHLTVDGRGDICPFEKNNS